MNAETPLILVPATVIAALPTYRDAVRECWARRTRINLMQRTVAEETGAYASHFAEYLSADPSKRDMPAKLIPAFERACGNHAVTQWLVQQAGLRALQAEVPHHPV